jgi:hypothetical protein
MPKQPAHGFRRDADAAVIHHESDARLPIRAGKVDDLEGDDPVFGELDRIANQIQKDLAEPAGVAPHELVQRGWNERDDLDSLGKGARG